jgi:hypothetical protein
MRPADETLPFCNFSHAQRFNGVGAFAMQIQNTVMTADVGLCVLSGWNAKSLAQEILPDGSQAAELAISAFRIPDGMEMDVFAAEPQVASPVAICIDEKGRVYAAEEYRFNRGAP